MNVRRAASILAVSLAAAGCSSSTASAPDDSAAVASAMVGGWQGSCFDAGNGQHAQLTFQIQEGRWAVDYVVYGDAACTAALGDVHIAGPFQILEPSPVVAGAHDGIFSFDTRTITPKAQAFADYLSTLSGCGAGGWKVDATQDVFETGCTPLGSYPRSTCTADYDVVKVGSDTLQFGLRPADNDMCSADKRPTMLGSDVLHRH
jgi:hypothetical protein